MTTGARPHDLPPLWDGRPVAWSAWTDERLPSLVFHTPAEDWACTGCGWIRSTELRAVGTLLPGNGVADLYPHHRLAVRRCPGCGLDEVTDMDTGEVWDLEDSDYTDSGSWPDVVPVQDTLF